MSTLFSLALSARLDNFGGSPASILQYDNNNNGDGNYNYAYKTVNGISVHEEGHLKNVGNQAEANSVTGSFSYTGPDGNQYTIQYIADENGFRPVGSHLPTPPPVPEAIQRSLGGSYNSYYRPQNQYLPPQQGTSFNPQSGYSY